MLDPAFMEWLWHPLGQCTPASSNHVVAAHEVARCKSYNFHSGISGEFVYIGSAVAIMAGIFKHWNCHEPKCWRHGKKELEGGIRVCDKHDPAQGHEGYTHDLHKKHLKLVQEHQDEAREGGAGASD